MDKRLNAKESQEHIDHQMIMVEASIDDMNPEFYGYLMDELFALGVNDVYIEQVLMKKNRPGQVLHVLCQKELLQEVVSLIFKETTTLGVRYTPYTVHRLEREFIQVETEWGPVTVKIGKYQREIVQVAPEYDQCVKIAKAYGVPLKKVYEEVKAKGDQIIKKGC